ncbi:VOC family protein [Compostibacter hankyongensis]|uniref:VOC family protein n=1 Tax=Compostibacter hankyongensis TaxID=1007089 RepID=A0ABP8GAB1_9BACT
MQHNVTSIRPFIGAADFDESRRFYQELGFTESVISDDMSYFRVTENIGFYLQKYYAKEWVDNTMIFLEVDDAEEYWKKLQELGLHKKYKNVRLTPVKEDYWGKECFLHDPSGILWHFGAFRKDS